MMNHPVIDNWRKATYGADNSARVETGWTDNVVGCPDTKHKSFSDAERPTLLFSTGAARTFLTIIKFTIG